MQPKKRPVLRMRHDDVSQDLRVKPEAAEGEMTLEEVEKQLKSVLQGMPNDLIKDFFVSRLKKTGVEGFQSASAHIDTINPKSLAALKFILKELLEYLKSKKGSRPDPDGMDGEGRGGQTPTQKDGQPAEEEGEEFSSPLESIEDYSDGEFDPDNAKSFMQEKIKKTIDILQELLRRIIRCEERLDSHNESMMNIKNAVEKLQAFKSDLPDLVAAQMIKLVDEMGLGQGTPGEQQSNGPKMGYFEMKDLSGQTRAVKGVFPKEWNRILQLATARENILLVGPTGCGKTHLSEMLAEALGLKYYSISCSEGMSENELKGWLLPLGEKGEWVYVPSDFVTAYETGGVFCLDEMDASDPNVLTWLNKAIGGKSFNLAIRKGDTLVKRHKDFVCVGCANTMGAGADMVYVGRNQLDGATRDRFKAGVITMDYSAEVEEQIIDPDVLLWGQYIRRALKELQDQAHHMSTRTMLSFSNMKKVHNWENKDWETSYFADWASADKARLTNVIKTLIENDIAEEQKRARGRRE